VMAWWAVQGSNL